MKIYCQSCGAKVEFSAKDKPKFCHNCGTSLSLGSNTRKEEPLDKEEADMTTVPNISQLEIEIQTDDVLVEKIEDIMGTSKNENTMKYPAPQIPKKEALKQFKKEAESLRKKGSTNET
tara:strand:+ start:1359 stop:1712 length:354 start_codon:yes stop_codon:yes gene_type:complete